MARSKKAIQAAQARYEATGVIKRKTIKLHEVHDADILKKLDAQENVNGYIKGLIRNDIKEQG